MPIPATSTWPKPKSENEWEDMVLDTMKILWKDPNASRHGRRGQGQYGIDIIGHKNSCLVAAQAKNYAKLTEKDIQKELDKLELFDEKISDYYLVISGNRDIKTQKIVRTLSKIYNEKFRIHILFFDDVCSILAENSDLIKKYYSAFLIELSNLLSNKTVLTEKEAFNKIEKLPGFYDLIDKLNILSNGNVNLSIRIENIPNLGSEKGSIERSWQIALAENHGSYIVTFSRIAVDVDNGFIKMYNVPEDEWIEMDSWLKSKNDLFSF